MDEKEPKPCPEQHLTDEQQEQIDKDIRAALFNRAKKAAEKRREVPEGMDWR